MTPALFVFSGLPAAGKSTLAQMLARDYHAAYLRIDTIEAAMEIRTGYEGRRSPGFERIVEVLKKLSLAGKVHTGYEGYLLAHAVAADNLALGLSVVADSCNPWELTRRDWETVAHKNGAAAVNIEVICSSLDEHKQRAEQRGGPTWDEICARDYHPWTTPRIVIDTAGKSPEESFVELKEMLPAL